MQKKDVHQSAWAAAGALWSDQIDFIRGREGITTKRGDLVSNVVDYYCENWDKHFLSWTVSGKTVFGVVERTMVFHRVSCPDCGRHMCAGRPRCNHCQLDRDRFHNRRASRSYRIRNGLVKTPLFKECGHCGARFQPARSTAQFCSSRCRVASHRAAKEAKD